MTNALEIRNLNVEIGGQELLHDLNLSVPDGEFHVLLGPNGCGKSTLMMTVMGFSAYKVTQGEILFAGRDITELDITERARIGIGLAQQRPPTVAGVTLQDVLAYTTKTEAPLNSDLDELINQFHLRSLLDRNINSGLSGGEIKRSELFQLLALRPHFAMIDEPDSGIDLESMHLVGSMVKMLLQPDSHQPRGRRAGLIITHTGSILDYIQVDHAHVMLDGCVVGSGNPGFVVDEIRGHGFEICARRLQGRQETTAC